VKASKVRKRKTGQPKVSTAAQLAVIKSQTASLEKLSEIMKCMIAAESFALSGFLYVMLLSVFLQRLCFEGIAPSPAVIELLDDLATRWGCQAAK
jgi:hypothetical protein